MSGFLAPALGFHFAFTGVEVNPYADSADERWLASDASLRANGRRTSAGNQAWPSQQAAV